MVAGSPGPVGRLPQAGTAISLLPESAGAGRDPGIQLLS